MVPLYQQAVKKQLTSILKKDAQKFEEIIERICTTIITQKDAQELINMSITLYRLGFDSATEQYQKQAWKLGYDIKVEHKSS